jgi:hypothetical protein
MNTNSIVKTENNGVVYTTVTDIAEYCEVDEKSTQKLILNNIDLFTNMASNIESKLKIDLKSNLKVPKLKLAKSRNNKQVDWSKTKLYVPHIELLLMLMRNTDIVKEHKANLITELFVMRVELMQMKLEEQNRLIEAEQKLITELENKVIKLESDKFIDWEEGYKSVSRFIKENNLNITSQELNDRLEDIGVLETYEEKRMCRRLTEDSPGRKTDRGTFVYPDELLERLV